MCLRQRTQRAGNDDLVELVEEYAPLACRAVSHIRECEERQLGGDDFGR